MRICANKSGESRLRERIARAEETGAEVKNNAAPKIGDISEEKEEKRTPIFRKGLDSGAGKRYNRKKREPVSGGCTAGRIREKKA